MKVTKLLAIFLALSLLLCGCGAESTMAGNGTVAKDEAYRAEVEEPKADGLTGDSMNTQTNMPINQKLIRKIWLDAETEEMDVLLTSVEAKIAELAGYVEARQVRNGSAYSGKRYRYAELTVRIPAEKLDRFVDDVSAQSNITNTRETTDDVTLSYVESESKVIALETEQTRLLELLAKAESMDDILKIESRLTDIRNQLERVKSQLRVYDNQINYGTVYLNITEVTEYTPVEEEPETIWERIGSGLKKSWDNTVEFLGDLLVFLIVVLPYLLPWAAIAGVVLLLIRISRKKKAKKNQPKPTEVDKN